MSTIARTALLLPWVALLAGCALGPSLSAPSDDPSPAVIDTVETAAIAELAVSNFAEAGDDTPVSVDCAGNSGVVPKIDGTVLECVVAIDGEDPVRVAFVLALDGDDVFIDDVLDATGRDPEPGGPTVPDTVIEDLAKDSLAQQDVDAAVLCESGDIPIEVGHRVGCNLVLAGGGFGQTVIEVISFDGDTFQITARQVA